MTKFRVLGRALQREDGRGKVTGEAHFTADVIRPDMPWGKILRSPLAHARIVSIRCQLRAKSSGRQDD
jgi:CO/xanthine dehydrogenase Mo-binding subunit